MFIHFKLFINFSVERFNGLALSTHRDTHINVKIMINKLSLNHRKLDFVI